MAGDVRFELNSETLRVNINALPKRIDEFVSKTIDFHAGRGEAQMRVKARWHDRSTNARNSLHTATVHKTRHHELILAHGMNYGIWLEIRFHGKYAIIDPTLRTLGPDVMKTLNKGMRRL